jgi:hypothetical protein
VVTFLYLLTRELPLRSGTGGRIISGQKFVSTGQAGTRLKTTGVRLDCMKQASPGFRRRANVIGFLPGFHSIDGKYNIAEDTKLTDRHLSP